MSKYCIYQDRPVSGLTLDDSFLPGCEIFGVHHDCKGCPNLIEMGDEPYAISATSSSTPN